MNDSNTKKECDKMEIYEKQKDKIDTSKKAQTK